jgi:protein tyrosine phosphatase (PTP) superfamily phosphohydrolase (DUF442 family)
MARWLLAVPPLLLLVLAPAAFVMRVRLLDDNLHTVIPGELYRSAQLAPESLDREIERLGLRSIVNLRGDGKEHAWYQAESETVNRHGVALHDLDLSGQRLPSRQELSALLDQLEHVERPALMHCLNGTDRSGLAASLAVLLQGAPVERARDEFALRHGYPGRLLGSDVPAWLDQYEGWLVETGRPSTPARLRSFVAREYTPYFYDAEIEALELPRVWERGEPTRVRVRVTNRSPQPWQLRSSPESGVHLGLRLLREPADGPALDLRGETPERQLEPGESIELSADLPPLEPGRYALTVDLVDEHVTWFAEMGSKPLERTIEVVTASRTASHRE